MENNKLWVFQSIRALSNEEEKDIENILSNFLKEWAAHGEDLKSYYKIINHKFIIIEVDENQTKASGCSMDSLNQCIRVIDQKYQLGLLNRLWVSYEIGGEINTVLMKDFKNMLKKSEINMTETKVYDLSVSSTEEFNQSFCLPIQKSWAKIYLN